MLIPYPESIKKQTLPNKDKIMEINSVDLDPTKAGYWLVELRNTLDSEESLSFLCEMLRIKQENKVVAEINRLGSKKICAGILENCDN